MSRQLTRRATWLAGVAAFSLLVLMPAAAALAVHGGRRWPGVRAGWLESPDMGTTIAVYRTDSGQVVRLPLHDYVLNVIAAAPGPDAPAEALKAAAVAARTYALYVKIHPNAQSAAARRHGAVLTDSGAWDLPWLTAAAQQARFGADEALAEAKLEAAVTGTAGEVATYGGQPIPAFMFPLSVGRTRDARWVLGAALPYLPSVVCPDDLTAPQLTRTFTFSAAAAARALGVDEAGWDPAALRVSRADPLGYALDVTDGRHTWTGADFANRLGLPSPCFRLAVPARAGGGRAGQLRVVTSGAGFGVGMSLHEAAALAARGKSYRAILATFYPGTRIREKTTW